MCGRGFHLTCTGIQNGWADHLNVECSQHGLDCCSASDQSNTEIVVKTICTERLNPSVKPKKKINESFRSWITEGGRIDKKRKRFKQTDENIDNVKELETSCKPSTGGLVQGVIWGKPANPVDRLDQMSLQKIIIFTAHENDNTVAGDKTPVRNIDITLRTEAHNVETFGKSEKSQSLTLRFHRSPSESSKERKSRGSSPAINHSIKSSSAPIHCHTGLTQEMEALNLSPDSASHTLSGLNAMKSVSINVSHQEDNCGRLVHENRTTTKDVHGKCDHSSDMPLVFFYDLVGIQTNDLRPLRRGSSQEIGLNRP